MDAPGIERALKRVAHEIIEAHGELDRVALAGIPTRGVFVAQRLAAFLKTFAGADVEAGVIDVSMHRDDLGRRKRMTSMQPTRLPADLEGKTMILTDDVLFSGRTVRAAMDALASFGRPARIQLAVLVDRGHRELPIRPDYVGLNLPTAPGQRVDVRFQEIDGEPDAVWIDRKP